MMDVDMSEMKYVNADGSEMNREELIAIIEKEKEESERKAQRICDLLNDKHDAYVDACNKTWSVAGKAKLYTALPDDLKDDETANDILEIDGALDIMQYICDCILERMPTVDQHDRVDCVYRDEFTKNECKELHIISGGTFEDACLMFTHDLDWFLTRKILELDYTIYNRIFLKGLKMQWKSIKEQLDGTAGLRALLG